MADNVQANAGSGGPIFAADDNSGVYYPYTKLVWGPDNTYNIVDVASGKALPVQLRDSTGTEIVPLTTSDFDSKVGSLTETAPATDIASSGLNGRLQRIAQRLSSAIVLLAGGLPAALAAGGGLKVEGVASGVAQPGSLADGAHITFGAKTDAKATQTDATSITAMQVWKQISASIQLFVFGAGTAAAAQRTTLASDDPAVATLGATSGAKVVTDAAGTIQQYLRGLVTFFANVIGAGLATSAFRVVSTIEYAASSALTITIASLATSSTWVVGRASTAFDNTTLKYPAVAISGFITTGTTPTVGEIQVWLVPILDDTVWPDAITGSDAAKTFTTAQIQASCGVMIGRMINTATSNIAYPFRCANIVSFLGFMPKKFVVFVAHSTVSALNATGGNHAITVIPVYM